MDDALKYEHLIRRAFQCGRYGVAGASADEYRGLERAYSNLKINKDPKKNEELSFNYGFECGEISAYIITALEKFINDFDSKLSDSDNQETEDIRMLLCDKNINKINEAIDRAEKLMIKFNLYPL